MLGYNDPKAIMADNESLLLRVIYARNKKKRTRKRVRPGPGSSMRHHGGFSFPRSFYALMK